MSQSIDSISSGNVAPLSVSDTATPVQTPEQRAVQQTLVERIRRFLLHPFAKRRGEPGHIGHILTDRICKQRIANQPDRRRGHQIE